MSSALPPLQPPSPRFLARWRQQWRKMVFLEKMPESGEVLLTQRRVFTLPSKAGWMFLLLLLILFISATNYNLSLGFALTFVLAASAIVNVFLGFRNLAYLHLASGPVTSVFAGEEAQLTVYLINRRAHQRFAIWAGWQNQPETARAADIAPHSQTALQLHFHTSQRGWQQVPRIALHTWFPLGLLRAWSTWLPDARTLVYPEPEALAPPLPMISKTGNEISGQSGTEDFSGVRAYQPGDPLKHLAWKHIARVDPAAGGQLVSKQFSGGTGSEVMLDFSRLPHHMDLELKLSRMTRWVIDADLSGIPYGFRLGADNLAPSQGPAHREACLRALALYQLPGA